MREAQVRLVNRLGLHARAAAKLVKCASRFSSRVVITNPVKGVTANAKSILSILALAASYDSTLALQVEGPDEDEAIASICELFGSGFGEDVANE